MMKRLTPVYLLLLLASVTFGTVTIPQITYKGDYLDPAGHPGIPYINPDSNWEVWEEITETNNGIGPTSYKADLYLNDGQTVTLLESYSPSLHNPDFLAFWWVLDNERVIWGQDSPFAPISKPLEFNFYNGNDITLIYHDAIEPYFFSPSCTFGPNFLAIMNATSFAEGFAIDVVYTDSMEQDYFELEWIAPGLIRYSFSIFDDIMPSNSYSIEAYQNGLDIIKEVVYTDDENPIIYEEHFWRAIPEPCSLAIFGFGAVLIRLRKRA